MNIKSLLIGSAAALVAVTGARAADVIMVEPEPVEYVRVCDIYGAGFYYIPGTETCIRHSGYMRFQLNIAGDPAFNKEGDDYQFASSTRLRYQVDVREETDLGTLRGWARIQADGNAFSDLNAFGVNQARPGVAIDQVYIQLGGLLMGYQTSLWANGIGGYTKGLPTDSTLIVGDFRRNQINYTFALAGFSATVGVEDDGTGDFAPDILAQVAYAGGFGGAYVIGVYDETYNGLNDLDAIGLRDLNLGAIDPVTGVPFPESYVVPLDDDLLFGDDNNDAFAVKAGFTLEDLLVEGSQLKVEGHYAFDETVYAAQTSLNTSVTLSNGNVEALPVLLEYAIGAGYSQAIGDFAVAIAGQYGETFDLGYFVPPSVGNPTGYTVNEGEFYALVGNVGYEITNNFGVLAEVNYRNLDLPGLGETDQTSGFLRFQRNF